MPEAYPNGTPARFYSFATIPAEEPPTERKRTPAEAVEHIRQSRKGVTLGGLKIKDLIHEGKKY